MGTDKRVAEGKERGGSEENALNCSFEMVYLAQKLLMLYSPSSLVFGRGKEGRATVKRLT